MINDEASKLSFRIPETKDGNDIWQLVKKVGSLDVNSAYSYMMLCDMFGDTCCVAEQTGGLGGFVSAFRKPREPETLFIWQIAVEPALRGKGIGGKLLRELLRRKENRDIQFVEATIGPDNIASRQLFLRLAKELKGECTLSKYYSSEWFAEEHDDELLLRIGPILKSVSAN